MKQKRIDPATAGIGKIFLIAITRRETSRAVFRLIWKVARYFFFPQFQTKFWPKTRPVVSVDHPLDLKIPFKPEYVNLYLTFIHVWIKSCKFVYYMFGKKSLPYIRDFVRQITTLYTEAAKVYLKCQSTTNRPNYKKNLRFRIIHTLDPHLHCVPSLHVMIVIFNYLQMKKMINILNTGNADCSREIAWMHDQAVSISESVLFVKQHSVNCIPAALFMLTKILDDFSRDEAHGFSDSFFTIVGRDLEAREEIRKFFRDKYDEFAEQKTNGRTHGQIILEFLKKYSTETIQN